MNLSLVSQKPSAITTQGLLAALRASTGYGDYFNEVSIAQPCQWQPGKEEAAILLLDGDAAWPEFAWQRNSDTFGLPVLPLLMRKGDATLTIQGPDVRDPRFYFVSNGIVLEESELADPACSRVLLSKLESYFPALVPPDPAAPAPTHGAVQLVTLLPASGLFKRHNICHN